MLAQASTVPAASPVPLGTALIAAGALLVGILITNWQQNRRESRNFERQLALYATQWADQREKDTADREEQRRRDHKMWSREDRHRFASERRVVYVDFLRAMNSYLHNVNLMVGAIEDELIHRSEEGLTNQFSYHIWLHQERPHLIKSITGKDETIADQVWILASTTELGDQARAVNRTLSMISNDLLNMNSIADAEPRIESAIIGLEEIRELMRDDLAPKEGKSSYTCLACLEKGGTEAHDLLHCDQAKRVSMTG